MARAREALGREDGVSAAKRPPGPPDAQTRPSTRWSRFSSDATFAGSKQAQEEVTVVPGEGRFFLCLVGFLCLYPFVFGVCLLALWWCLGWVSVFCFGWLLPLFWGR
jgi:hypothetical protein